MRAYVVTTGVVFGLITLAHLARLWAEGSYLLTEPGWVLLTVAAAALCAWAMHVLRTLRPS